MAKKATKKRTKGMKTISIAAGDAIAGMTLAAGHVIRKVIIRRRKVGKRTVATALLVTQGGCSFAMPASRRVKVVTC